MKTFETVFNGFMALTPLWIVIVILTVFAFGCTANDVWPDRVGVGVDWHRGESSGLASVERPEFFSNIDSEGYTIRTWAEFDVAPLKTSLYDRFGHPNKKK